MWLNVDIVTITVCDPVDTGLLSYTDLLSSYFSVAWNCICLLCAIRNLTCLTYHLLSLPPYYLTNYKCILQLFYLVKHIQYLIPSLISGRGYNIGPVMICKGSLEGHWGLRILSIRSFLSFQVEQAYFAELVTAKLNCARTVHFRFKTLYIMSISQDYTIP